MEPSRTHELEEYSAASTTIPFDRPLPLLRGPVPAGPTGDPSPSAGPFVLAFRDAGAWRSAFRACESKIAEQCEAAARIGCAMSASSKCKPPWWRNLVGPRVADFGERERCEEREMEACLAAAKEKCSGFARERCLKSFRNARISATGSGRGLDPKQAERFVSLATVMDKSWWIDLIGLNQLALLNQELGATNFRASELIGCNPYVDCILVGSSGNGTPKL